METKRTQSEAGVDGLSWGDVDRGVRTAADLLIVGIAAGVVGFWGAFAMLRVAGLLD